MTLRAKVWPKLDAFVKLLCRKFQDANDRIYTANGKSMGRDTYNTLHGNHFFIDIFC